MVFGLFLTILGGALFGPWGALAGSLLGAALFPAKAPNSPMPDPPTSETFSYGTPIKKIWNAYRCGGTRIWQTDIEVVRIKGKKHGFFIFETGQDPDTFQYRASWAVLFCSGPAVAVRKIWADGKLIYDVSADASAEEVAASRVRESATHDKIIIHLGDEDQEPVAEMSTADSDHVHPAYRGRVIIVFYDYEVTKFGGRIPTINAEILEHADVDLDEWADVSSEIDILRVDGGRVNAAHCVAWGYLWMFGGYLWDGSSFSGTGATQRGLMQDDGTLLWSGRYDLLSERGEFEVVFVPSIGVGVPDKLISLGGYDYDAGQTLYDAPDPVTEVSEMVLEMNSASSDWVAQPVIGDPGGLTAERIPFPRDSLAAQCFDAPYPWGRGIWVYGGRCTHPTASPAWVGPSSMFRDLWFYNEGNSWQLLTEITTDEWGDQSSEDGGGGYRMKASMVVFKGSLYMLGGVAPSTPKRDCLILDFDPEESNLPRFASMNSDVMASWPNDASKTEYYIAGATVWRERLVALMSKGGLTDENYVLWVSDDGIDWELWNKGEYAVTAAATGLYTIAGDHTDDIEIGDTLTAVGASNFYEHDVTGVTLYGDDTRIEVDSGVGSTIPTGTLYIHQVARNPIVCEGQLSKSAGFESYKETLYLLGGVEDSGPREDKILIHKAVNSIAYPVTIPLQTIVDDLCENDAGINEDLFDASELTDGVHGACAANRPAVEEMINMFRQFGFFDCVDSDGILKFIKRGGSSVVTITEAELATDDSNKQDKPERQRPEKAVVTIEQEGDLPRSVEVIYPDIDLDYSEGAQIAKRSVSEAKQSVTLSLTIAMDAEKAHQIAEINLFEYWASRKIFEFRTTYAHLRLDPSDVVTLDIQDFDHLVRIREMDFGTPRLIQFKGVKEEPHIYSELFLEDLAVERDEPYRNSLLKDLTSTGVFLDIPILSLAHDDCGFYWGAYPTTPDNLSDWYGADLYMMNDDSEYIHVATVKDYLIVGTVAAALGSAKSSIWDNNNVITVVLTLGTLSTATEDEVYGGANLAMLGDEILYFCDAVNISGDTWQLSKLLRGRFGTEHEVDAHETNEQFVLLDMEKLIRIGCQDRGLIGTTLTYQVTPLGGAAGDYTDEDFTCEAIGKKPLSPANLTATRLDSGVWKITWMRRSRGVSSWAGGLPLPLNEDKEIYEIDFYQSGVLLHTQEVEVINLPGQQIPWFALPVAGFDYTNAEGETDHQYGQDEIYGGVTSNLNIKIYQISATVGRGFVAEGQFTA